MGHRIEERARTQRYRLYPTFQQEQDLLLQGHGARALWNLLHTWWLLARKDQRATWKHADAQIKQARRDIPWLALLPAQASQQVLKTYRRAWDDYWSGKSGRPKYQVRRGRLGIDLPQARDLNITFDSRKWSSLQVPLIGRVTFRQHRKIVGVVTGARIVREADGRWYLAVRVTQSVRAANRQRKQEQPVAGLDRGIVVPAAVSDGSMFTHDAWLTPREQERFLRLEREGARKRTARVSRGGRISKRERECYRQIAVLHARARRRRSDWLHKITHELANTYSMVGVEALNVMGMTAAPQPKPDPDTPGAFLPNGAAAKAGLSKAILAEAWGECRTLLTYKTLAEGGRVIPVPAAYTSLTCHQCRTITSGSRENQAVFTCRNPLCGWSGNADYNAACNIEWLALQQLASEIDAPARVLSSALGVGLKLTSAGGTPVAARSGYIPETPIGTSSQAGVEPSGWDSGIKHGEPDNGYPASADPIIVDVPPEAATFMWR